MTWSNESRKRIRQIQDSLIATTLMARTNNAPDDLVELLMAPFREMLDEIYERDLPLAKLADTIWTAAASAHVPALDQLDLDAPIVPLSAEERQAYWDAIDRALLVFQPNPPRSSRS